MRTLNNILSNLVAVVAEIWLAEDLAEDDRAMGSLKWKMYY